MAISNSVWAVEVEQEQQSRYVTPVLIVNVSFMNVRSGPGTEYGVLLTVPGGTELPVLGVARDLVWYQVSTVVGAGWVNVENTIPRGNFSRVPYVSAPALTIENVIGTTTTTTTTTTTNNGTTMSMGDRDWGIGILASHFTRTAADPNSISLGEIPINFDNIFPLLDAVGNAGFLWLKIDVPNLGVVWVEGQKTYFRPFACPGSSFSVAVFTNTVYPGPGPDGSGSLDGSISFVAGLEAYILDARNGFFKVEFQDGATGWIRQEEFVVRPQLNSPYCDNRVVATTQNGTTTTTSTTQTVVRSAARVIINTGNLNVRSGPGSEYASVAVVAGGTELDVIGFAPDSIWYQVRGNFGVGWVNSEFTIFRGNGRGIPIVTDFGNASLARPSATITNAVTLYAAPNPTLGTVGALSGPLDVFIVARTPSSDWIQVETAIGFGWVQSALVRISGDLSLVPVVGG
ncbi:MAG: SH3 domain-containing protein [Anaerolineae bacterium]|nr:SH3 domain-containing protein [Anaerolineae bacterium]